MDEVHPIREKKEELELFRKKILLGLYQYTPCILI